MHVLIVGKSREERLRHIYQGATRASVTEQVDAAALPFRSPTPPLDARPRLIRIDDVELAFPDKQSQGTRLILTQSTYLIQKWLDVLRPFDRMLLTGERLALTAHAPEAFDRRGPWRQFEVVDLDAGEPPPSVRRQEAVAVTSPELTPEERLFAEAYRSPSSQERLSLCRHAAEQAAASPAAALALASACRECHAVGDARKALDRALALAPGWEAAHYEDGKFWLACEDMERALDAFDRACRAMPTLTAAWSNLGATLGELDRPDEALAAFQRALESDPDSFMVLNNIGVVAREMGRLDDSEAALMRVNRLAPGFVFGHYNRGHTLLLAGRVVESLAAYEEGWRRDAQKNRRQGCRLAVVRLLHGDATGARQLLWECADRAPADERQDLLLEAFEITRTFTGDGSTHTAFLDEIAEALRNS